jgi:hypothetical protein
MKCFHRAALRRLVRERLLKLLFYEVAGTVNFTAECACLLVSSCQKQEQFRKQDQSCILAQKILLCGKLRLEFFRERLFSTRFLALSSVALVTAAEKVQKFPRSRESSQRHHNILRSVPRQPTRTDPRFRRFRPPQKFLAFWRGGVILSAGVFLAKRMISVLPGLPREPV